MREEAQGEIFMKITTEKSADIDWKPKNIDIDLANINFEIDALQNELINKYLRQDKRFLTAWFTNFTPLFIQFIKDKVHLGEPITISIMGQTRCQPKGSKLLMANGEWKNIEDVKIGDRVISPQQDDSILFSNVIEVNKGHSKNNYLVMDKIRKKPLYFCSENHKIPFNFPSKIKRCLLPNGKRANGIIKWKIIHLTPNNFMELSELYVQSRSITSFLSPEIKYFEERKNPNIEPYSLGMYIGDGFYSSTKLKENKNWECNQLGITTSNKKIIKHISQFYKPMYKLKGKGCDTYKYSAKSNFFKQIGLLGYKGKKANKKFIPKECLLADINYRKKLLAGLIDSDGTLEKNIWVICSVSKQLSEDIKFLVNSLGGQANIIKNKIKKGIYKGKVYYKIYTILHTKLPLISKNKIRKINKFNRKNQNSIVIFIKKTKPSKVFGITIDSPSQWYVTDNFMVTHNSGKSTSAITVAGLIMEARRRLMDTEHILENEYKLLEVLKNNKITQFGDAFVIDESKQAVYGVGSTARKFKLSDIQNIIAVNNISTLWLRPDGWSFDNSQYGLRAFGRGQFYKDGTLCPVRINKFMLYNLQESSAGGSLPLGMIYLPHFEDILKNGKQLWKDYSQKKQNWVDDEQHGEADTMMTQAFSVAEKIYTYPRFQLLKSGSQKKTFIATALGSEATTGETKQIYEIIKLLENGFTLQEIKDFNKPRQ